MMSGIARTANLLFRSSRASLLRPAGVNPVHHVFANNRLAARGLATAFERTKPHVNIGKLVNSLICKGFILTDLIKVPLVTSIMERYSCLFLLSE